MSEQAALMVRDNAAMTCKFTADALAQKQAALESSALIGRVTSQTEKDGAVAAQVKLNDLVKSAEKQRKEMKEPVIKYGRNIDAQADEFKADLQTELDRVAKMIGDFNALELAKVRAAEAARQLEIERQERELRDAEEKIRQDALAAQRKLDEAQREVERQSAQAKTAKTRAEAEQQWLELERQRALSNAATLEQLDKVNEDHSRAVAALPVPELHRAKNEIVKEEWEIQVTDIHKLARAHPNCVEIKPRLSDIKALLDMNVTVHGITAKKVVKASVRRSSEQPVIEA